VCGGGGGGGDFLSVERVQRLYSPGVSPRNVRPMREASPFRSSSMFSLRIPVIV